MSALLRTTALILSRHNGSRRQVLTAAAAALPVEHRRRYSSSSTPVSVDGRAKTLQPPSVAMPGVWEYVCKQQLQLLPEDEVALIQEAEKQDRAIMMGSPDEAAFLAWLVELMGARKVMEVGVFRGTTTLSLAKAVGDGGRVVALDITDEYAQTGKKYWEQAGVADRIDFRVGSAVESMDAVLATPGEEASYDLCFIDANKTDYDKYFEKALKLVRKGGVIAVDNTLWHGQMLQPKETWSADTAAIAELNEKLLSDARVKVSLLSIADGVTLCRVL
eukprot:TRINITY_DN18094_c0_g1_i1.p1 TRINITY_DN18094_c0_g1~~TRINITY_DN18094_c0_g1_i1.p1  ORF type:complete len:276 (+),score=59.27 TRINITY_DN18094_c0_g1_i1:72-899(+)